MGAQAGANGTPLRILGVRSDLRSEDWSAGEGMGGLLARVRRAAGTMSLSRAGDEGCQLSSANLRFALACISSGASKATVRAHGPTLLTSTP